MPLWTPPAAPNTTEIMGITAALRSGVNITSGAVDTKGAYTELIASTAADAYGFWTRAYAVSRAMLGLLTRLPPTDRSKDSRQNHCAHGSTPVLDGYRPV